MNRTFLYLTGGLGNQLFQLSAGLSATKNNYDELIIDGMLGNPRLNEFGKSELESLQFPLKVKMLEKKRANYLLTKLAGFLLRSNLKRDGFHTNFAIKRVTTWIAESLFAVRFGTPVKLIESNNLGFFKIGTFVRSRFLIGYFQSYKYLEDTQVRNEILMMFQNLNSAFFLRFQELAAVERPLVIHIRLGDYKNENSFGILNKSYYEKALIYQLGLYSYSKIWLFSDEIYNCMDFIPEAYRNMVRFVDDKNISSADLLQVMTLGHGFIIANSTFSWWGASLSENGRNRVVAPDKWFNLMDEPLDLIPSNWMRLPAHSVDLD